MPVKYVFVTGGVVSGLGKGITAASLGRLLKARGYKVTMQKFDPYINIDPGTMNPIQHGEVFVTDDGAETDLDLGHYERFIDESLTKNSNVTTGKVYWTVLQKERRGDFGGGTVQVIPHITNEIKSRFYRNFTSDETHIAIIEVGGTVGDIESQPFLEAIRQFQHEIGHENAILIHVTLIPYIKASGELKTKPTQASVKELQGMGIQPDLIVCRSEHPLEQSLKDKIALFCNVPSSHVLQNLDVEYLYEAPLAMEKENLAKVACESLHLECPEPDLKDWEAMVDALRHPNKEVTIALVGKYIALHDAYISVVEALKHGGIAARATVHIKWIDSEDVTDENAEELFSDVSGILVPGGFGSRGVDGKILAARYAREHQIPYLGLCLGMQIAIIEFARHVCGYNDAHSIELDPATTHPVIALMPDQSGVEDIGGTLRLGAYPCVIKAGTTMERCYGTQQISERHRHRYEFNN
ncbi:MAG: CTP synthase, partial [Clostridiales bacterium]|nr:CTP synthase [Clostridiales bacterium]